MPASLLQDLLNSCGLHMLRKPFSPRELLSIPQVVQSSVCKAKAHRCPARLYLTPNSEGTQGWSFTWHFGSQKEI